MNLILNKNFEEIKTKLINFFSGRDDICFAYVFGSIAKNALRPLSDIDIAVYLQENDPNQDLFEKRIRLLHQLFQLLGTERIDLIILNNSSLELNYRILKSGYLLIENKPEKRIEFYHKIVRNYLDFSPFLNIRNKIIQKKMFEGTYFD